MNNINKNLWLIEFPRMVLGLFVVCNIIAMLCYSGGTYLDHLTPGYSFTQNFFSDLGRTISFAGKINYLSSQLSNMSMILAGGIFILFYFHTQKVFINRSNWVPAFIGSIFGILGGFSLIGVGLSPANLYLDLHIIFATWLFRFFFLASICYSLVIFLQSNFEKKYALGYIVFAISILLYIFVSELGPDPKGNQFALTFQVISQKIILFVFMTAIYIQTLGLKKLLK